MEVNLRTQLKPTELEELQLMGAMVARGESPNTIESRWKKLVTQINTAKPIEDINELIQCVLSESYLETNKDLQFYAAKVKYINDLEKQVSDEIIRVRKLTQDYIGCLEQNLSSVGDDAQLANMDLQNALQEQNQLLQTISSISKTLHDTANAIISNIR